MAQIFRPGATTYARMALVAIPLVPAALVVFAYLLMGSPYVTGQYETLDQNPPFSHEHHARQLGIGCPMCHGQAEKTAYAGMPATHVCMSCHSQIWTNAAMLAPVRESYAHDEPLSWKRVHNLPDYVYFNHSVHVNNGVGCSSCHGNVEAMPLMRQAAPLTMGWCLDCHKAPEKHLRPQATIYDFDWSPLADQESRGRALVAAHGIDVAHLVNCSVCHR
ncbi:cytochrome c3 family protein [Aureimonas leprariae]|uniref:Cytochrome c3 family protein n=1 Tax=Plantimonas leprariae TaxID=2615207 RepID=A0A7V7PTJ1_9HYPH|nr:cytochrome c3 family protein [Aureimonas leprariae]KAB0682978.1 cytochrome c3 family protein [Aureimonas leprariae]